MSNLLPITEAEVKELAKEWFLKLDVHAPIEGILPMLAEGGLEMVLPETTLHGLEDFKGWYERVIGIFFNETHTLKEVNVTRRGEQVDAKVIVKWEASIWKPPAPKSERIILHANQTWTVKRSPVTRKPVISRYIVDSLEYAEGSARL